MENWETYLQILVRWVHFLAGIFWIGATLYLGRMGRSVVLSINDEEEIGTVRAAHGGFFWIYRKLKRPPMGGQKIHLFRWESLVTWISGMILFVIVYWRGGLMYSDEFTPGQMISIGGAAIVIGVLFYWALWSSIPPGSKHEVIGVIVSYVAIVTFTYLLGLVLPGRAVWMHVAVTFGTIMAIVNVWLTILPSQTAMLRHDAVLTSLGGSESRTYVARLEMDLARAARCTKHNTYMMVPLTLMMVSNHFPTTLYGTDHDWFAMAAVVLVGWGGAHLLRTKF